MMADQLETTTTPDKGIALLTPSQQLGRLADYQARKQPGSLQYYKVWRTWIDLAVSVTRHELVALLSRHSSHNDDDDPKEDYSIDTRAATTALSLQLGIAADHGAMPSFQDARARAGYAVGYFGRARLLAHLLFHANVQPPLFRATCNHGMEDVGDDDVTRTCRVTSIGGGPGFDFCAAAFVASLENARAARDGNQAATPVSIHATIFDYEKGWEDLVNHMAVATTSVLAFDAEADHSCQFGGACDITKSLLSHESNAACALALDSTDIWTCQYCVTENASLLRDHDFIFFRELFQGAKETSLFVFTDTSHRVWPELVDIAKHNGFKIAFVHGQGRWKSGYQMLLQKNQAGGMSPNDEDLCETFRRDAERHRQKLAKGYSRPTRRMPEK